jgi:cell wall-associated NlpC family hydrolase
MLIRYAERKPATKRKLRIPRGWFGRAFFVLPATLCLALAVAVTALVSIGEPGYRVRQPAEPRLPAQVTLDMASQAPSRVVDEAGRAAEVLVRNDAAEPAPAETHTVTNGDRFSRLAAARGIRDWAAEAERIGLQCPHDLRPGWVITFAPGANVSLPCPSASKAKVRQSATSGTGAIVSTVHTIGDHSVQIELVAKQKHDKKTGKKSGKKREKREKSERSSEGDGSSKSRTAVKNALEQVGKPYRYGASGPNAFDCSGLVKHAFSKAGVNNLPRTSRALSGTGKSVSRDELQPGDLVFFYKPVSHVAIYIGDGKIVHASNKKQPVKVSDMGKMPFSGARRVV